MAEFRHLLGGLRRAEAQLERQLEGVKNAIASLSASGAAASVPGKRGRPAGIKKRRRTMSAEARAKIGAAQRARWAKLREGGAKKK